MTSTWVGHMDIFSQVRRSLTHTGASGRDIIGLTVYFLMQKASKTIYVPEDLTFRGQT